MLKHLLSLLSLLLFATFTFGQSDKTFYLLDIDADKLSEYDRNLIDSLLTLYHKNTADTAQLALINELIDNCYDDVWIKYNQFLQTKAKATREKTTNRNSEIYNKATYYYAVSFGNIAYIFDNQGQVDSATHYYKKALGYFSKIEAKDGISLIYNALAQIYENSGKRKLSIETYQKAAKIAIQTNDSYALANVYLNLGRIHNDTKNHELALKNFREGYKNAKSFGDKRLESFALFKIATIERIKGNDAEAIAKVRKGFKILDQINNQFEKIQGYILLGRYKIDKNELDSAYYFYQQIFRLAQDNKSIESEALALNNMAFIRIQQNAWNDAYELASTALQKGVSSSTIDNKATTLELLAQIYEHKKNYQQANHYLKRYFEAKNKIMNDEIKSQALKEYYELEYNKQKVISDVKYSKQLAIKEEEKKQNQIIAISIGIFSLLIVVALLGLYNRYKFIQQQKKELRTAYMRLEESKKNELLVSNLKALQSQMNPHFIFNALNSIQTLVLKGDIEQSYTYINKFADLVRKTLLFSEQKKIPLSEEIALLGIYLKLEKLRFKKEFDYKLETNNLPQVEVPPMLIQPFIENSLRHGLLHKKAGRKLHISFWFDKVLYCKVSDNGIGREASRQINQRRNKHKSFAIGAIRKRFEMLQENYPYPIGFTYKDLYQDQKATGTEVRLCIPFTKMTNAQ